MHEGLVQKKFTSQELTSATFEKIQAVDDKVGAFLALNEEEAMAQAKAADEKGYDSTLSLQGLPIGIKDNIVTRDLITTAARRM